MRAWGLLALVAACGDGATARPDAASDRTRDAAAQDASNPGPFTTTISAAGGHAVGPDGVGIDIPPYAVAAATPITITRVADATYAFAPANLVFARPVTVTMPVPATVSAPQLLWPDTAIGGELRGGRLVADVVRLAAEGRVADRPDGVRDIEGAAFTTWRLDGAFANTPLDLTGRMVGLATQAATTPGDGTFRLAAVPAGPFLLRADGACTLDALGGPCYLVTSTAAPDLGFSLGGRADAALATAASQLTLGVDHMTAWQDGDSIEALCPSARDEFRGLEAYAGTATAGATAITGWAVPVGPSQYLAMHLISTADACEVMHLTTRTSDAGLAYRAATDVFEPAPFALGDGATVAVTGSFVDRSTDHALSVTVDMDAFLANAPALGPGTPVHFLAIRGLPFATDAGYLAPSANELQLDLTGRTGMLATGTLTWGAPAQGTWTSIAELQLLYQHTYTLPGTTYPASALAGLVQATRVSALGATLSPLLGPPGSPTIDGLDLRAAQTVTSTSPTIAWTAPTLGVPTLYGVSIRELRTSGSITYAVPFANFETAHTSLQLPSLPTGSYVIGIAAYTDIAATDRSPARSSFPHATATILSDIVTVP